jgi:flagellar biogenesis protein FliO
MKAFRFPAPVLTAALVVASLCATPVVAQASTHARRHPARKAHKVYHPPKGLFAPEKTRLTFSSSSAVSHASTSGGSSILRTILGLLIVIGLIYAITFVMRRIRRGREGKAVGSGLASVATLPLGGGRSLHLVRAAQDLILVGASEHGVTPIRTYTEEEARASGLIGEPAPAADELLAGAATEWQPAAAWQESDGWRTLTERPTPIAQALEHLRRLTVRS